MEGTALVAMEQYCRTKEDSSTQRMANVSEADAATASQRRERNAWAVSTRVVPLCLRS